MQQRRFQHCKTQSYRAFLGSFTLRAKHLRREAANGDSERLKTGERMRVVEWEEIAVDAPELQLQFV